MLLRLDEVKVGIDLLRSFFYRVMALPRAARLSKSNLIEVVQKKGALWKTPFFRIRFLPARFGVTKSCVIISKKTESSAVKRNTMRRRVTDALVRSKYFPLEKNFLMIIYPNEKTKIVEFSELQKTMDFSLQKILTYSFSQQNGSRNKRFPYSNNKRRVEKK